jgi:TRAP-type mannitol/chloroaromatic compound transport system substrate-binding protein
MRHLQSAGVAVVKEARKGAKMDYKALSKETIDAVKWATRKEDESFGGEVLAERLSNALVEAGVDIESRLGFAAWYGAPEDVVMSIILAFVEDDAMSDGDDAAISRIQADLYDALQENGHLEESNPDFWSKAMSVL